ncbi:hypothetical protein ABT065_27005, partial [Streptomyces sp. NPDC002764]|uniref:hypothetical protein n=1 Tax=Streptomyces sp. NPDC002764 TaxID=3154428 RepID=UPI00332BD9C4
VLGAGLSGYVAAIRVAQLSKNIQSGSPAVRQSGSADNGQPQTLSITSAPLVNRSTPLAKRRCDYHAGHVW